MVAIQLTSFTGEIPTFSLVKSSRFSRVLHWTPLQRCQKAVGRASAAWRKYLSNSCTYIYIDRQIDRYHITSYHIISYKTNGQINIYSVDNIHWYYIFTYYTLLDLMYSQVSRYHIMSWHLTRRFFSSMPMAASYVGDVELPHETWIFINMV